MCRRLNTHALFVFRFTYAHFKLNACINTMRPFLNLCICWLLLWHGLHFEFHCLFNCKTRLTSLVTTSQNTNDKRRTTSMERRQTQNPKWPQNIAGETLSISSLHAQNEVKSWQLTSVSFFCCFLFSFIYILYFCIFFFDFHKFRNCDAICWLANSTRKQSWITKIW